LKGSSLQTIERVLSQVSDGKAPLKFPAPVAPTYTILAVDARTLFHGRPDRGDLDQVAFGAGAVPLEYRCYWPVPDGSLTPIRGFFDPANRSTKAKLFQERVHFVAFILERTYEHDELCRIGYYVANPTLFQSQEQVEETLRTFPLYKRALQASTA
jgi:hypothetical protein